MALACRTAKLVVNAADVKFSGRPNTSPLAFLAAKASFVRLLIVLPLVLGDDSEDTHGKRIGIRHGTADKVHPGVTQGQDEASVTREPVEFGDEQGSPLLARGRNGSQQLRPLVFLATLHFHILRQQLPGLRREGVHGRPLRFQSQARLASPNGGDTSRNVN
jgi:hypothetical protein